MSDETVDVFQERKSKATNSDKIVAEPKRAAGSVAAKKTNGLIGAKTVFALLGVIGLTWALWPMFVSSTTANTQRQQMLNPEQSMSTPTQQDQQSRADDETAEKLLQAFERTEGRLSAASAQIQEVRSEAQAVVGLVRELQAKVALVEQRLTEQKPQAAQPKPKAVVRPAASRTVIKTQGSDPRPGQPVNYTINTIYNDQAWLETKDRTYIVQVGDEIDGMKVIKINASDRTVLTSAGLVR